jgi:hypothetical protein
MKNLESVLSRMKQLEELSIMVEQSAALIGGQAKDYAAVLWLLSQLLEDCRKSIEKINNQKG